MHSIDSGDADRIDPQHENSISGHMGSHGNDRFHIAPDMTVPGHNQFSQGMSSRGTNTGHVTRIAKFSSKSTRY